MSKKSDGFRLFLALCLYISCFIFTLGIGHISLDIYQGNEIPTRKIVLLFIAIITWFVIAYYSEEPRWRTLLKLFCYSLTLFSIGILVLGVVLILKILTEPGVQVNISASLMCIFLGGITTYGLAKLLGSKWLNEE